MAKKKKKKKVTEEEPKKRGGNHPKHPKCQCGRALYKTLEKGKASKKDDPWRFCRNENCELYAKDQSDDVEVDDDEDEENEEVEEKVRIEVDDAMGFDAALIQVRYDDTMPGG
jgi:hypothetical protein